MTSSEFKNVPLACQSRTRKPTASSTYAQRFGLCVSDKSIRSGICLNLAMREVWISSTCGMGCFLRITHDDWRVAHVFPFTKPEGAPSFGYAQDKFSRVLCEKWGFRGDQNFTQREPSS